MEAPPSDVKMGNRMEAMFIITLRCVMCCGMCCWVDVGVAWCAAIGVVELVGGYVNRSRKSESIFFLFR